MTTKSRLEVAYQDVTQHATDFPTLHPLPFAYGYLLSSIEHGDSIDTVREVAAGVNQAVREWQTAAQRSSRDALDA